MNALGCSTVVLIGALLFLLYTDILPSRRTVATVVWSVGGHTLLIAAEEPRECLSHEVAAVGAGVWCYWKPLGTYKEPGP